MLDSKAASFMYSNHLRNIVLSLCVDLCSPSEKRKCEQVNPLVVGLQHHMEVSPPLVAPDKRYHMIWHEGETAVPLLWECGQQPMR